ncbi:hypothetical protein [Mesorhizobium sp. M2E.F.Ca.ET.166.01.1.1]|uniref:hypothetical protein n=1 Tax=Mesorhizobium sp. M2E.F.Ca.ET.166.01.1.1 TaxID=2500523 RepID=UPI000FDB69A1|nr:hypothetical protein [Mesorhizobium sp. M2E.F.Ca.ET.166.01.1.1]TGT76746.1 hypothetical protein EN809_003850 [Mesorhizobium sp. M2E.F.Ca.ET.166.01.1.1]TGW02858.1 hypothetical protein EN797_003850 [Mesorhizobium sp. M2E.F.Ca.ET.154.01.1.1]
MTSDHILDGLNAATKLFDSSERELWRPDRNDQMAAIEILLASSIPFFASARSPLQHEKDAA